MLGRLRIIGLLLENYFYFKFGISWNLVEMMRMD